MECADSVALAEQGARGGGTCQMTESPEGWAAVRRQLLSSEMAGQAISVMIQLSETADLPPSGVPPLAEPRLSKSLAFVHTHLYISSRLPHLIEALHQLPAAPLHTAGVARCEAPAAPDAAGLAQCSAFPAGHPTLF